MSFSNTRFDTSYKVLLTCQVCLFDTAVMKLRIDRVQLQQRLKETIAQFQVTFKIFGDNLFSVKQYENSSRSDLCEVHNLILSNRLSQIYSMFTSFILVATFSYTFSVCVGIPHCKAAR